ncbi:2-dehydro-3-deoxyphosphogluconate aldolase / 4-hydroxy-2-oxoglutarate aldolase [Dokdonia sp. MED134]|uniref:bifunctional 4-hydroxy-2-oxoglutarate aldolase/2-dehydro-3-deoxy-phosphogluconate aldolase n=1 Tax=Dokdonia sp. MED134 TaxID=313590 RepID=UPI000068BF91|nr:bifunctional 4-hydroxy-2-oxoglutarate aldolase/2-dehydro-3-deoxy-phosphogluconate aldolase [Dokdonia sp. MED134]EAQ38144.1 2-dehydro-3-deoxyphosphogluconate aldolase / 4-hydroxy-2-oxoglutarate aldolase [Dokdonia sp. MED134]
MARFTRIEVAQAMKDTGIVPLFYNESIEVGKNILKACHSAGARVIEFTSRGDNAHKVFDALCAFAKAELPELILGVGSITDGAAASLYMQLGANFIVTPVLREDIALVCNRRKVLWSPGCGSLTEIARAEELGCEVVKLFPGGIYGAQFVKAIKGPCPWTSIMPTGGVSPTQESLEEWFNAGVTCVGMGSKLIAPDATTGVWDYKAIEQKTKKALDIVASIKKA